MIGAVLAAAAKEAPAQWPTIVAASFAAVAACASWAAVWLNWRERIAARTPDLHLEPQHDLENDEVRLYITSNGGPAKGVDFTFIAGHQMAEGHPEPTGVFRSGESRLLLTNLKRTIEPPMGLITCLDMSEQHRYAWSGKPGGDRRVYRLKGWRRHRGELSNYTLMREFYPDFDPASITVSGHHKTIDRHF
ncbi:MAG: hypothetical protein ACYDHT_06655 [Solirubrobacteraceae bacterium]